MSRENVEVVRRLFEDYEAAMERGDLGTWFDSEHLADDAEWIPPVLDSIGMRSVYRGREEWLEFMRTWTEDFEDWSVRLDQVIDAGGDRVVGVFHQRATGKGSGVPVELRMALLYELEGGKVIRMRNFLDPADALEAAGLRE
jgi:ketosteroid isomerase-like protein